MDTDLFLVIGLTLGGLTIPSLLSAFTEGRTPRSAAIMVLIAGTLVVLALTQKPSGYSVSDIPDAFARVIGRMMN